MWISRYVVWFFVYSILGWIWETIYCTARAEKWMNRGFLYGPLCPIYGFGGVGISIVLENWERAGLGAITPLHVFLLAFFGSIILEYSTSYVLEKLFHAVWWDYSNMPLNIHGRICLPATTFFGLAGLFIVFYLYPAIDHVTGQILPIAMEGLALILVLILGGDLAMTISALTDFESNLKALELNIDRHMQEFVESIEEQKLDAQIKAIDYYQTKVEQNEHLIKERERFMLHNMNYMLDSMSNIHLSAVGRIEAMRPSKAKKDTHRTSMHERVRKYLEALREE